MKKFNLYDKIKELQEIDAEIKDFELAKENIINNPTYYEIFGSYAEQAKDIAMNDESIAIRTLIRRELLQQISIISNYEAKKINSELISN